MAGFNEKVGAYVTGRVEAGTARFIPEAAAAPPGQSWLFVEGTEGSLNGMYTRLAAEGFPMSTPTLAKAPQASGNNLQT